MKPLAVYLTMVATLGAPAAAQELCTEPIRPESAYLLDAGLSGAEVRAEFRRYFGEVEDYLNCLNETSGRIREDARAAAYEYQHVLETTEPGRLDQDANGFALPRVEMKNTGELYLDHRPRGP